MGSDPLDASSSFSFDRLKQLTSVDSDEADVFLQNRSGGGYSGPSAEGSALVSGIIPRPGLHENKTLTFLIVFLKVLEYYSGILFLTTNQIAQFDVAVESRVHIALYYPKLSQDQTTDIFMSFVKQYYDEEWVSDSAYEEIKSYAANENFSDKGFDGRQLRNIVGCAMSHAKEQKRSNLTVRDIEDVVGYVSRFQSDLAGRKKIWREGQKDASLR